MPRHDGCVKPKRASRKSAEEPLGKRGKERKVPVESDKVVKKRRGPNVSKPAQEDQPQSGKKTAGRSRGLQHEVCRAAKAGRKQVASMKNHTEPTATVHRTRRPQGKHRRSDRRGGACRGSAFAWIDQRRSACAGEVARADPTCARDRQRADASGL